MRTIKKRIVAGLATAAIILTAATPVLAKRVHHDVDQTDVDVDHQQLGPNAGYGYGGYARTNGPSCACGPYGGGYGYGYAGGTGLPYYYGGGYPYGYYQYPTGYAPDPYYGYGTGNYGTGLGY